MADDIKTIRDLNSYFEDSNHSKRFKRTDTLDNHGTVGLKVSLPDQCFHNEDKDIEDTHKFLFREMGVVNEYSAEDFYPRKRSTLSRKLGPLFVRSDSSPVQNLDTNPNHHDKDTECKIIIKQDADGDCILHISIICGRRYLVISLVNLLCSPKHLQVTNNLFQNALHLAAIIGDHVMVRRLLVGGIVVDRKDRHGNTALHIACDRGYIKIADALLTPIRYEETKVNQYKTPFRRIPQNMELRDFEGQTCLHVAAKRRDLAIMELLLSKNADINARYMKDGKTVLHHFCEIGDREFVVFLMKRNDLNLNARSYSGTSALDIAKYRGHNLIVSMILYSGAYRESPSVDLTDIEISDSDSE